MDLRTYSRNIDIPEELYTICLSLLTDGKDALKQKIGSKRINHYAGASRTHDACQIVVRFTTSNVVKSKASILSKERALSKNIEVLELKREHSSWPISKYGVSDVRLDPRLSEIIDKAKSGKIPDGTQIYVKIFIMKGRGAIIEQCVFE